MLEKVDFEKIRNCIFLSDQPHNYIESLQI